MTSQIRVIAESRTLVDVSIGGIRYRGCLLNTPLVGRRRLRHRVTSQSKIMVGRVSRLTRHHARADESAVPCASLRLSRDAMTAGVGMGLSKDGLARFAAVAASHVGEDKVPGLVALV